jgi:hypothetical protein
MLFATRCAALVLANAMTLEKPSSIVITTLLKHWGKAI